MMSNDDNDNNNLEEEVPDELLLIYFRRTTKALLEMNCRKELIISAGQQQDVWTIADCRRYLLEKQTSLLHRTLNDYNNLTLERHQNNNQQQQQDHIILVEFSSVTKRLARLHKEEASTLSDNVLMALGTFEEAARLTLCRMVLFNETQLHHHQQQQQQNTKQRRDFQTSGKLDRSRLLEFCALCEAAVQLRCVKEYLIDGSPMFDDDDDDNDDDNVEKKNNNDDITSLVFPQTRLEHIQHLLSRAVGWDPEFTRKELGQLYYPTKEKKNYFATDSEVMQRLQHLTQTMTTALMEASTKASTQKLNDLDQGGVTRVVSVQYSEIVTNLDQHATYQQHTSTTNGSSPTGPDHILQAPTKESISNDDDDDDNDEQNNNDEDKKEEEKKRQLRMASQAAVLQQELLAELFHMSEDERNDMLEHAKEASEQFLQAMQQLAPGPERVQYLQNVPTTTSKLLAMHKLWTTMLEHNGGQPPTIAKKSCCHHHDD